MTDSDSAPIDEAMIGRLVHSFYARVRQDEMLGPIFETRIHDWDAHLLQMCRFWSSVMLKTGRYRGTPMPKHAVLPVDATHFAHWLELFRETAREVAPEAAPRFEAAAQRIADSLLMGVEIHQGRVPQRHVA